SAFRVSCSSLTDTWPAQITMLSTSSTRWLLSSPLVMVMCRPCSSILSYDTPPICSTPFIFITARCRSEEHTSELQSRENLVRRLRARRSFPTRRSSDLIRLQGFVQFVNRYLAGTNHDVIDIQYALAAVFTFGNGDVQALLVDFVVRHTADLFHAFHFHHRTV